MLMSKRRNVKIEELEKVVMKLNINAPVELIKGIGSKKGEKFKKLGIRTYRDLLFYFPRQYEDRRNFKKLIEFADEEKACVELSVVGKEVTRPRKSMEILKVFVKDDTSVASIVFFNQKYLTSRFEEGKKIKIYGKAKKSFGKIEFNSPEIEFENSKLKKTGIIYPIYSLTYGLNNEDIIQGLKKIIVDIDKIEDYIPLEIRNRNKICDASYALKNIHFPEHVQNLKVARYRMVFEEFFFLQIGLFTFRRNIEQVSGIPIEPSTELGKFLESLPFSLTKAQRKVLDEILSDMKKNIPMNRLVQGDVGSGKTVVAAIALYSAVLRGYQGALMAPTEILANQHFESFESFFKDTGVKIEILTGSTSKKKKEEISKRLVEHDVDIIIGTHSLLEDYVEFENLGLVVTDEQHRFGVRQRNILQSKGRENLSPHVLVMTATPIPRTLSLIFYGDLDISTIDELPPGRKPIDTFAIAQEKRKRAYEFIKEQIEDGRQAYIVCPLVEESEQVEAMAVESLYEDLKSGFLKNIKISLLHGKMKSKEKDDIMQAFKNNEISVLISTTVIEVGVNVPNSTVMVVENAERFGLSQLHQLRGRIGRGGHKSYCILIYKGKEEYMSERMKIMEETNDGFLISQKDLEIRGPGEFLGTRQHGVPELKIGDIIKHMDILKKAQEEAKLVYRNDPQFNEIANRNLRGEIEHRFQERLEEIALN